MLRVTRMLLAFSMESCGNMQLAGSNDRVGRGPRLSTLVAARFGGNGRTLFDVGEPPLVPNGKDIELTDSPKPET